MRGPRAEVTTAAHSLRLLPGAGWLYAALRRDLRHAGAQVLIESYIVRDDRFGQLIGERMVKLVSRGGDARLLYDPLGSQHTAGRYFAALRREGVGVRAYRGIDALAEGAGPTPRDHSRVLVIDEAAYTGGANIGLEWLPRRAGGVAWHDVCVRVTGPCVEDFRAVFNQRWREAEPGGAPPRSYDSGERHRELRLVASAPSDLGDSPILEEHLQAFARARRRIWIANAYFYPTSPVLRALTLAQRRGIDVRILIPGESDLPFITRAARADHVDWLALGLRVWEYQGTVMHAKYAVVDEDWCAIGTFNVNPISLCLANEIDLFVFDPGFVARLAAQFRRDLRHCRSVTIATIYHRPLLERMTDRLARGAMSLVHALVAPRPPSGR